MEEFQVKRGRPKKLSVESWKLYQKKQESLQENRKNDLNQLQNLYTNEVYSQKLARMLNTFPVCTSISEELRKSPLKTIIEEAAKVNMISEVELALASIYLNKMTEKLNFYSSEEIINSVFFRSKFDLENNKNTLESLRKKLESQFKNFGEIFKIFDNVENISISEINKQYKILNKPRLETVNYSYYVDLVLRTSPPYVRRSKKSGQDEIKKKFKYEDEEIKPNEGFSEFSEILPLNQIELGLQLPDTIQFIDNVVLDSSDYYAKAEELSDSDIEFLLDLR